MATDEAHAERPVRVIECPKCDTPSEVVPVTVLRPDDEALAELFAGQLNVVTCEHCGASFTLNVPVLFRDDEGQSLIYFLPLEDPTQWHEAEQQMVEVTRKVFANEPGIAAPTCRLALRRSDFVEKIALHFRGLDDRVVEYVKYQLLNHPGDEFDLDPVRQRLLFDFSQEEDENLAFLVYERETNQASARTHLPMETYHEIAEMLLDDDGLRDELDQLFPGAYVSVERLAH